MIACLMLYGMDYVKRNATESRRQIKSTKCTESRYWVNEKNAKWSFVLRLFSGRRNNFNMIDVIDAIKKNEIENRIASIKLTITSIHWNLCCQLVAVGCTLPHFNHIRIGLALIHDSYAYSCCWILYAATIFWLKFLSHVKVQTCFSHLRHFLSAIGQFSCFFVVCILSIIMVLIKTLNLIGSVAFD